MANPLLPPSHTINISLGQIKLPRVVWRSMCKHVEGGGLSSIYSGRDYMPLACSFPAGQNQRPRWICPKPAYTPRKWRGTCPLPLQRFRFRTGGVCQTLHFWKFNRCLHPKQQRWLETMQAAGLVTNAIFIRCFYFCEKRALLTRCPSMALNRASFVASRITAIEIQGNLPNQAQRLQDDVKNSCCKL